MKKYVALDKRSKKAQKEFHDQQRRTWGELSPVTRTVPNGKAYNRKKMKQEDRRGRGAYNDGYSNSASSFSSHFLPIVFPMSPHPLHLLP